MDQRSILGKRKLKNSKKVSLNTNIQYIKWILPCPGSRCFDFLYFLYTNFLEKIIYFAIKQVLWEQLKGVIYLEMAKGRQGSKGCHTEEGED